MNTRIPDTDFYVFEPGNATRYEILCTEIGPGIDLFVWVNAPSGVSQATKLAQGNFVPSYWLEDRMNLRHADAAALLAWLRDHRGYKVRMPSNFNQKGLYSPSEAPTRSPVYVLNPGAAKGEA